MEHVKIKIMAVFFILGFQANAFASEPRGAAEIQRNIENRYRQQLLQREIESRTKFIKDGDIVKPRPVGPLSDLSGQMSRQFSKIKVVCKDVPGISVRTINKITKPYENIPIGADEISFMQSAIQNIYLENGYASARIYMDGNTLADNVLTFVVREGYIEDIVFKKADGTPYSKTSTALQQFAFYPFAKGELLNIRDLDQGIEQVNKLSSNNAVMEVSPGTKDGYSVIEITNHASKRFALTLGADNSGLENTGVYKANGSISADNLLMLNDNIYFNYSRNIDGNDADKENNSYFASLNIPFGYFTFMFSYFNSDYVMPSGSSSGRYTSDGSTENMSSSLEMVIKRAQSYKVSAGAELALKEAGNNFEGTKIEVSSKKLSIASAFLTSTHYIGKAMIYTKLTYNRGLDSFGAVQNKDDIKDYPKGQFDAYLLYLQYFQPFRLPIVKLPLSYSVALNGQFTPDILYSSEQMSIGGESSVRGFKESSASGDSGGYVKNDISVVFADIFKREGFFGMWRALSFGLFADYGYARHEAHGSDYQIAGAGTGLSFKTRYFNASGSWSRQIYNESDLKYEGDIFYIKAEAKIYF